MGKRLKTGFLVLASLIIFAGVSLYALRNPLLEALISTQLSKRGLPLQSISTLDISLNDFRLQDLTAGKNKELRVGKILVTWQLQDLLIGKPASVEISGLQWVLDLSGERPPSDSLQALTSTAGSDISIPWLPNFSLKDSAIHLHATAGNATVALSGDIQQDQPGTQAIHFSAVVSGSLGQTKGTLAATLDRQGNMRGKVTVAEGMLDLPEAKISSFAGDATFTIAAMRLQHIGTEFALSKVKLSGKKSAKPVSEQAGKNPAAFILPDTAIDQISIKGDIRGLPDSWSGQLDLGIVGGQSAMGSMDIRQISVSLPMQVILDQTSWRIGLRNPGQVTLGKINSGTALRFQNPLKLSISQANLELVKNSQGLAVKHDIAVIPADFSLLVQQDKSPAIEAQIHPGKIALTGEFDTREKYQGRFTLSDTAVLLPQSQLQLNAISATLHLDDPETGTAADFAIGQLQHLAPEPLFAAVSINGSIRNEAADGKPAEYALNVAGGVPDLRYLKITGKHSPISGNGMLKAEIVPLNFSPDRLQPSALSPVLSRLEAVSGQVSASAQFNWSNKGVVHSSRGAFELRHVSFAHETAKVDDLNASLRLENLLSPSSLPQQTITIRRIDTGIPVENLLVSYQIEGADPPRIALEKAQFSMMDGILSLAPTIINPAAAHTDVLVHVNNIDLGTFFNLIQINGLTGSGHLDGQIPIRLEDNQVMIRKGHLAAKVPGVLRFHSAKASQLLATAGEEMNLLLQAVQDFHYTELSLDLDKSATHGLIAKLSLLGNNPEVKDGQVFRLNINLESDIDKILQTINQGYNLSHEILRNAFRRH
ncbi:YdbH domain-containing protein [Nitrosomonas sp.]|uniref:YdbH domain-containing protein n=1 Tax=Nitrosomonas sp. TaxID=42353 RepID=UPI0025DA4BA3|nr:YdbH domain-containing protein [Nitrosomonas sp.]